MRTRLSVAFCLMIFFSFLLTETFSNELMTEPKIVQLVGKICKKQFLNPNTNKEEEALLLKLDNPIDVAGDDFNGPSKNVKEIQLVLFPELISYKIVKEKYINKKVLIEGSLFHAHTVHHYTDVLIKVKAIKEVNHLD